MASVLDILKDNIVALASLLVTLLTVYLNFRYSHKEKVLERKNQLYEEIYSKVVEIRFDHSLAFSEDYYELLSTYLGKLKLSGSMKVYEAYEAYYKQLRSMYMCFVTESNFSKRQTQKSPFVEDGALFFDPNAGEIFKIPKDAHIKFPEFTNKQIDKRIEEIYKAMHKDLGR